MARPWRITRLIYRLGFRPGPNNIFYSPSLAARGHAQDFADGFAEGIKKAQAIRLPLRPENLTQTIPLDRALLARLADTEGTPSMNTEETIAYDDKDELVSVLVGHRISSITETTGRALAKAKDPKGTYYGNRGEYDDVLEFHLDNGVTLRAHAHDGGCGCSNGCFSVDLEEDVKAKLIGATILGVQVEETVTDYYSNDETPNVIINGEGNVPSDGSSTIRVFVYTDLASTMPVGEPDPSRLPLVTSMGGDNGYYGWGFHFSVDRTIVVAEGEVRRGIEG
ncbi:hypothetical protein PBI_DEWDROP_39 [Microbacterium phage Dewdrop]|nr:hypothetical protein PBI_LEAF_39 [Microbacterium phage Leaf]QGZ17408.1 hypothetical protein PBI_DEWDROP_39 [Microbacterium phage Dewdrop]